MQPQPPVPEEKFEDLPPEAQKVLRHVLMQQSREILRTDNYPLGLEATYETVISLYNKGYFSVCIDEEESEFLFLAWDVRDGGGYIVRGRHPFHLIG